MIIKQYIKDFENYGFGLFVHFGIYSLIGKGEWAKKCLCIRDEDYEPLAKHFNPKPEWADELVKIAKSAGCKYITLTTRHHDGYSLFDTCGLNSYDAPHSCGRDLIKEFTDACNKEGITPFFYHTLLDWYNKDFDNNFPEYLKYLRDSVEILCKNYGKIGGLWFDGMWSKPDADWEEDALYSVIRKYQPEAMIINNTGMIARGKIGNIELDSVTFERGKPQPINLEDSPKYIASEMCQVFGDHWGYTKMDLNYKSVASIIEDLCACRRYGSNFLLNIGPMGDGSLRSLDKAMLETIGEWTNIFDTAIRKPRPTDIEIKGNEKDFVLKSGDKYYVFIHDLPMIADSNVAIDILADYELSFKLNKKVKAVSCMDNGEEMDFEQNGENIKLKPKPFCYGENLVVRVAMIETERV